ncbi:YybH family protein [Hymenobacter rubripertinctus]|uniref:Nuclear transport factor 2 family protein n=1 Tax=Hymenobacter rubripertinctus TaxID=2029981 RepID=A0A418R905_9BACT|nr:nuclear transport factor 2 family protein [Hymenobacter rubripertinctus]RIY13869.1 nuclear transport factor 2 family protein [Hymenobacter rubripertinctus]
MKPLLLTLLLAAAVLPACTPRVAALSPAATATARHDILAVLQRQTAAWNRGDVAGFMHGYWQNDSLVFIGKSGLTYGYQPTLDNYRRSYPSAAAMGQLDFTHLRIQPLSPDAAHVIGRWHLARPAAGDLQGHFLLVFRRLNGEWVVVADHSS